MNKMVIKIDLSAFFKDERKMVYILVDPNWESVESLQKRLQYLFKVESVRLLNCDGCYLPPEESIEIIKFCKGLKAFVPNDSFEERKHKKSKKSKCVQKSPKESESEDKHVNIGNVKDHNDVHKKRKYYSMDSVHAASTPSKNAKRQKCSNIIVENLTSIQHDNKSMEITSTSEQYMVQADSSKNTKTKHSKGYQSKTNATSSEKKKELLTEKEASSAEENIVDNAKTSVQSTKTLSSTFLNESKHIAHKHSNKSPRNSPNLNNPFRKSVSSKAHIYFNESGEIVSTTNKSHSKSDKESKTIVVFRCPLQEVTKNEVTSKPRIFCIERKSSNNKKKKQLVEIKESIVLEPIPSIVFKYKSSLVKGNEAESLLVKETEAANSENEQKNTQPSERGTEDTKNTSIAKNTDISLDNCVEKSLTENSAEVESNNQNSITKLQSTKINQSGLMPVDCVDLSMESEEGDANKSALNNTNNKNTNDSCSDVEEISEIIDLNETEDNCYSSFNNLSTNSVSSNDIRVEKILPFCTNITELPNINDIIVFKIAYANKKQHSEETNFLAGKVEYINKRTKCMKVLIIDGLTEMRYIDTKFILNCRDSEDFSKYLQVKMCDIIEPKVFSRS